VDPKVSSIVAEANDDELMYADFLISNLLLRKGADSSIRNNKGETALMIAARRGKLSIVKLLLQSSDSSEDLLF
jgi:ankyrin repeat protein